MFYYKNHPISCEIAPWREAIFAVEFVKHFYQYTVTFTQQIDTEACGYSNCMHPKTVLFDLYKSFNDKFTIYAFFIFSWRLYDHNDHEVMFMIIYTFGISQPSFHNYRNLNSLLKTSEASQK